MSVRARRVLALAILVLVSGAGYGLVLARFDVSAETQERHFGAAANAAGLQVYLEPIAIDAVSDTMQVRISVLPPHDASHTSASTPERDLDLVIYRGGQADTVRIRANEAYPEVTFAFDLEGGSIRAYPLDAYTSLIQLAGLLPRQAGSGRSPVPIGVTVWEGILGYTVRAEETASALPGEMTLRFGVQRTGAVAFLGLAMYGAMAALALCGLTVGVLVFVGYRRIEVTLVGALGAIVFALPALRRALPGDPPLGIRADMLVFFWAELAAVLALCLFVSAWVRNGARP